MGGNWSDVATLVVRLVSHEPPFVQIMCVVGAAFTFVIFLDGLRVNFVPAKRQFANQSADGRTRVTDQSRATAVVAARDVRDDVAGGNISLPVPQQASAPKTRFSASAKSHQVRRPNIRRTTGPSN